MKKLLSGSLVCLLIMCQMACESEPKENYDSLYGKWELETATKSGKLTELLTGLFFDFSEDGSMRTNVTGTPESVNFSVEEGLILQREGRIDLDEAQHIELNLKKLLRNRIDCYISNYYVAAYSITRLGYQGRIVHLPEPLVKKKGTYMAISRKSANIKDKQEFISRMNEELKDMHDSGLIMRIINTYIETPPKK